MESESKLSLEAPPLFDRLRGALLEDLSGTGDVTSQALVPEHKTAHAEFLAKSDGVLCGVKLLPLIFQMAEQLVSSEAATRAWALDDAQHAAAEGSSTWDKYSALRDSAAREEITVEALKKDGQRVVKGDILATVRGNARAILAGERTSLNLLSHLSGIATQTASLCALIAHTQARLLETRKTMPLWRDLQKYAVKCGGGENHRKGLYDQILIKDNHLELWGARDPAGAVRAAQARFPHLKVEVEVTDLEQLRHVFENCRADIVLLDNFSVNSLRDAVHLCTRYYDGEEKKSFRPELEASGGITRENLVAVAETGVQRISVGALTHSVPPMDISMKIRVSK